MNTMKYIPSVAFVAALVLAACSPEPRSLCSGDKDCQPCERCQDGACKPDPHQLNACGRCEEEPEEICGDNQDNDCDGDTDEGCGDPCHGVTCDSPPGPCHEQEGTCSDGVCLYPELDDGTDCNDGDECTLDDQCLAGVCRGTLLACDSPPDNHCLDANMLRAYTRNGTCVAGVCSYGYQDVTCPKGCEQDVCLGDPCAGVVCDDPPGECYQSQGHCHNGVCHYGYRDGVECDDQDACTRSDTCLSGHCAGDPIVCNQPPPNECVDAQTMRSYSANGICTAGACTYVYQDVNCSQGCQDGLCLGDPCQGVVCDQPPNSCYQQTGTCEDGVCYYDFDDQKACDDQDPCTENDMCQSGSCSGEQLACDNPPADFCVDDFTLRSHLPVGACSLGECEYDHQDINCAFGCQAGHCAGDPCAGVVCDQPPDDECLDADTARVYQSPGICDSGVCNYTFQDIDCTPPQECSDGLCREPIPCDDDDYEDNDDAASATQLAFPPPNQSEDHLDLVICTNDADWLAFEVPAGSTPKMTITFDNSIGDLDLKLYDEPGGSSPVDSSTTSNDYEFVTLDHSYLQDTVFYLEVYAFAGAENTYDLRVTHNGCTSDADCPAELPRCLDNLCVPECTSNTDCPVPGEYCIDQHCQQISAYCDLVVNPETLRFETVEFYGFRSMVVTLANFGATTCTIDTLELAPSQMLPSDFSITQAPSTPLDVSRYGQAGDQIEIEVTFAPTVPNLHRAYFWLHTDDDPDVITNDPLCLKPGDPPEYPGPGDACITVTGMSSLSEVYVIPGELNFGRVTAGCKSPEQPVTAYNYGSIDVSITDIYLEDPAYPNFEITSAPATPYLLSSGSSIELRLHYSPQELSNHGNTLFIQFEGSNGDLRALPLFGQGVSTTDQTDHFARPAYAKVDVLFVVDNSTSMQTVQDLLASSFDLFIQPALDLGVDFHVGVITTEVNDEETGLGTPPRNIYPGILVQAPGRPKIITSTTPDLLGAFTDNASVGACCSDEQEAGLEAAGMALTPPLIDDPTANGGFLRADASLYMIFISDENDQSIGTVDFYLDLFGNIKEPGRLKASTICGDCPNGCDGADCGSRYMAVVDETGGIVESICDTSLATELENLGLDAFTSSVREFTLSRWPDPETISVTVASTPVGQASAPGGPDGWTYYTDGNTIYFGDDVVPGPSDSIEVSYTTTCY